MKYRFQFFPYLVIPVVFLFFFSCQKDKKENISSLLELKHLPADHFFLQRSYPDRTFDIKAYTTALEGIKAELHSRNISSGFDADWTVQGPGDAGARVNTIAIHPNSADTVYAGFSGGGIFKTSDGGSTWFPIFDDQPYLAIGDITIDPNDPQTIYVGTGDPNITGYPFIGDGVYKSTDGGTSWTHMGLSNERIVSKVIIDPSNSNIIYAACMGLPFERNNDRGLYKSTDGGNTWTQKLFVSDQAGIIDMLINPVNPQILYAASWDRIRNNQESLIFGLNAKIHKSIDGGDTWTVLSNGLPSGEQGRIGLAMSGSNSDVIFAVYVSIDSQLEGVYKSIDGGTSWTALPSSTSNGMGSNALGGFGWYFGQIRVDPDNDNIIWILGVGLWKTSNSGSLWFLDNSGNPHVDNHELICYNNDLYLGTDGGMYIKTTLSSPWTDFENIPATQFYRTGYNPHQPDQYYGGTQDNGTQQGNGDNVNNWDMILGGDGFEVAFNFDDPDIMYAETQRGNIFMKPNAQSGFINATSGINGSDRRNWDMQYIVGKHDPDVLYTGTYRVYRSEENGLPQWQSISGDLTDGDIYGSSYHTITTLSESPIDPDLLYVGTTDGNVWRTTDGGTTWDSLHADLPDRYVTSVVASPDSVDFVYVGISGYRYNDFIPHIHFSTNKGDTWTDISGDLPQVAINNIFVLPDHDGQVIFVATDGGVYGTLNGGTAWERLGNNMPMVPVYDLDWNIANNQLIAATFGRSIMTYPLDSIDFDVNPDIILAGTILTETGAGVDSVFITLDNGIPVQTDIQGDFDLGSLPFGSSCTITPAKDINYRNGVSTLDILLIQSHILTIDSLDSPYKIIAADVNHTGTVSALDLIHMRKLILFDVDTFPDNDSWRFVDGSYTFSDPYKPLEESFPETITCDDLSGGAVNFIGLKVGDVNGNANPGNFSEPGEGRSVRDTLCLYTEDQVLQQFDQVEIPIKVTKASKMAGFQFTVEFDSEILEYQGFRGSILKDLKQDNFGLKNLEKGLITFSWNTVKTIDLLGDQLLMSLKFKVLSSGMLGKAFMINSKLTKKEAYSELFEIQDIEFKIDPLNLNILSDPNIDIFPNPFTNQAKLIFKLNEPEPFSIRIYDINGKLVKSDNQSGNQGTNTYPLESHEFPGPGVYLGFLDTKIKRYRFKLIILD